MSAGAVPDVVAPPPRHPRFPLIDGMRAIAVLSILVVHAVPAEEIDFAPAARLLAHLNIGVTVFFVISGFLLYRPFVAHRGGGAQAPPVLQYAKRRLLRIYPAYWLALTALAVFPGLYGVFSGDWWAHYALLQTIPGTGACDELSLVCGLPQTWSLVVEMTFYATLPLYVLAAAWLTRRLAGMRWVAAELALLAALSIVSVLLHYVILDAPLVSWPGGTVIGFVFWFALGMGMAVLSAGLEHRQAQPRLVRLIATRPLLPWLAAFAAYALLSVLLPPTQFILEPGEQLAVHVGFGLIAALLMAPAVFGDGGGGLPRRTLALPVVAWLGLISYGIFLWHQPIALELGDQGADLGPGLVLLGTLAITIPVAAASYYLLERPLLRLKYR